MLPEDYKLDIPKSDKKEGFDFYIESIIPIIEDIYTNIFSSYDLSSLFQKNASILSFRIHDKDTEYGTIEFERFSNSIDSFRKIFSQITTFVATNKPIFGNAENESQNFLERCRALQTEKGSFITKFEILHSPISNLFQSLDTEFIIIKLFDILDFLNEEVINNKKKFVIDNDYIKDYSEYINIELFYAIKDLYNKARINKGEYYLNSYKISRSVEMHDVLRKTRYFSRYIREIKKILMEKIPLETIGRVYKLSSESPLSGSKNIVIIEANIGNKKEKIKLVLDSSLYQEAIEAHRNEFNIKIKGFARETKTQYIIKELEEFKILPPTQHIHNGG
jgi:hypothetical protein